MMGAVCFTHKIMTIMTYTPRNNGFLMIPGWHDPKLLNGRTAIRPSHQFLEAKMWVSTCSNGFMSLFAFQQRFDHYDT